MGRGRKKKVQAASLEDDPPTIPAQQTALDLSSTSPQRMEVIKVPTPPPPSAVPVTRRSLRNQMRMSLKPAPKPELDDDEEEEEEEEDEELSEPEEPTPRKKRFLKETTVKKGGTKQQKSSTAQALNRLITNAKRVVKPPERMIENLPGRSAAMEAVMNGQPSSKGKKKSDKIPLLQPAPPPSQPQLKAARPPPPPLVSIKMEVQEEEIQEEDTEDPTYTPPTPEPRKRGRKRKAEATPTQLKTVKREVAQQQNLTSGGSNKTIGSSPPNATKQKRGRQSAATESITPRFPFCSLCLSKNPPSDYMISHMSFPNEYQRMKRLFVYIYKDLKFPFLPFDLERENAFDYCDLPLCDSCIVLYKQIYESYAQIEAARDQLKEKVEEMVRQIQFSEANPVMSAQLKAIKNSPDSLMNKYCNSRRRFVMYRPGDSRSELDGSCLIPATIARIRVINPTPKRTSSSQTLLTSTHFTALPSQEKSTDVPTPAGETSSAPNDTEGNLAAADAVEKDAVQNKSKETPSLPVPASNVVKPTEKQPTSSKTSSTPASQTVVAPKLSHQSPRIQNSPLPSSSSQSSGSAKPSAPDKAKPASAKINLQPVGSANIVRAPGRPLILSKSPVIKQVVAAQAKPSASSGTAIPAKPPQEESVVVPIKEEPIETDSQFIEEADPFFSNSSSTPSHNTDTNKSASAKNVEATNDSSLSSKEDKAADTNVFRKHKKLRILSVPPEYEEQASSNSSDATDSAANENSKDDKNKSDQAKKPADRNIEKSSSESKTTKKDDNPNPT